jgi:hypothetical protein
LPHLHEAKWAYVGVLVQGATGQGLPRHDSSQGSRWHGRGSVTQREAAQLCLDAAVRTEMERKVAQRWPRGKTRAPSGGYVGARRVHEQMARQLGGTCMTRDS